VSIESNKDRHGVHLSVLVRVVSVAL
jgi:hypothetical protein